MAKLSARGRTIVAEATKITTGFYGNMLIELKNRLMSDRVVLSRSGRGRWVVKGKLKPDVATEQWVQHRREQGWTVTLL